jgi:hypothetical protein
MIMPNYQQLLALAKLWLDARPLGLAGSHGPRTVPDALLATITAVEPYRSQAIDEARTYLATPKLAGIALTYQLAEPISIVRFERWETSISPLKILLRWSLTMDSDFNDAAYEYLHRVAVEDAQWKIVSIWDDTLRKEHLLYIEQLKRLGMKS